MKTDEKGMSIGFGIVTNCANITGNYIIRNEANK